MEQNKVKNKTINFRATEEELKKIEEAANEAGMTKSDYILCSCLQNKIIVLAAGADIAKSLHNIRIDVKKLLNKENMDIKCIDMEVKQICQLLNFLMDKIEVCNN
jgi:Tfp pilus assembly ATPase PilU